MREEKYVHPEGREGEFILLVYLDHGDRHEYGRFMSYNEGRVFIHESPWSGTNWQEFNSWSETFYDMVRRMKAKGWVKVD